MDPWGIPEEINREDEKEGLGLYMRTHWEWFVRNDRNSNRADLDRPAWPRGGHIDNIKSFDKIESNDGYKTTRIKILQYKIRTKK